MKQPTTERLAQAMTEAGCPPRMIGIARVGYYDQFTVPESMPIFRLVYDLQKRGFSELADRAIAGEFSRTSEEISSWLAQPPPPPLTDDGATYD